MQSEKERIFNILNKVDVNVNFAYDKTTVVNYVTLWYVRYNMYGILLAINVLLHRPRNHMNCAGRWHWAHISGVQKPDTETCNVPVSAR